jgi:lysophospholipase L1-like esterase
MFEQLAPVTEVPVSPGRKRSGRRELPHSDRWAISGCVTGNRVAAAAAGVAIVAMLVAGAAWAGTIIGTPKGDVLRGSPLNDKLYGKAGNDRLYGYGGNDLLAGGPGADLLAGGAGRDVAIADKKDRVRKDCEVVKGLPKPPPPPDDSGLYISLGASTAAGEGASVRSKAWVNLYFGYLASNGSGVTRLVNLAQRGHTSTDLRMRQLPGAVSSIRESSDTLRVTIGIGRNDLCDNANDPGCPLADNLRAILTTLNEALAGDPGDETIQIMEYYNDGIATAREAATRRYLLGSDLKVDCSGTGSALGLNDLIHCIALEKNALPVELLPAFDAAGESFLAEDHFHPNDAGHLVIARAFGGAVEPAP